MFQALWVLVAYSYNIILVLFIAIHLFVGAIISFVVGLYIGIFLSQNYEIPRINEPRTLWEKFLSFLEKNRRDPQKISIGNILRPTTMKELILDKEPVVPAVKSDTLEKASAAAAPTANSVQEASKSGGDTEDIDHESFGDQGVEDEEEEVEEVGEEESDINDTGILEMEEEFPTSRRLPSINTTLILSDNELEEYERELEATSLAENFKDISPLRSMDSGQR